VLFNVVELRDAIDKVDKDIEFRGISLSLIESF